MEDLTLLLRNNFNFKNCTLGESEHIFCNLIRDVLIAFELWKFCGFSRNIRRIIVPYAVCTRYKFNEDETIIERDFL